MKRLLILLALLGGCTTHDGAMQAAKDFAASVPGATGKVQCEHGNDDWLKCNIFRANEMPLSVTCDNSLCVTFNGEPPHHNTTVIYTPPASGR